MPNSILKRGRRLLGCPQRQELSEDRQGGLRSRPTAEWHHTVTERPGLCHELWYRERGMGQETQTQKLWLSLQLKTTTCTSLLCFSLGRSFECQFFLLFPEQAHDSISIHTRHLPNKHICLSVPLLCTRTVGHWRLHHSHFSAFLFVFCLFVCF